MSDSASGNEVVCSECGTANDAAEMFCAGCGTFLEWQTRNIPVVRGPKPVTPQPGRTTPGRSAPSQHSGPSLKARVSSDVLSGEAGSSVSLEVELHNTGSTVDRIGVELLGPAERWALIEPAAVNLLPGSSGRITITFNLPDKADIPGTTVDYGLGIRSAEHPQESQLRRGEIRIKSFTDFGVRLRPTVLRASGPAAATVSLTNAGLEPLLLTMVGDDVEGMLDFRFTPGSLRVEPRSSAEATVQVIPRDSRRQAHSAPISFSLTAVADGGHSEQVNGTYVPEVAEPRPRLDSTPSPRAAPAPTVVQVTGRSGLGPIGCLVGIVVGLLVAIGAVALVSYQLCASDEACRTRCLDAGLTSSSCNVCEFVPGLPGCPSVG